MMLETRGSRGTYAVDGDFRADSAISTSATVVPSGTTQCCYIRNAQVDIEELRTFVEVADTGGIVVRPSGQYPVRKVRALIDMLTECFGVRSQLAGAPPE